MAASEPLPETIALGPQGRLVIPSAIRKALDLKPGDRLVVRLEEGRVVLEPREAVEARLHRRFAHIPRQVSLVDELLRERRREARREKAR